VRPAKALWAGGTCSYHLAYNALTRVAPKFSAAIQRATGDSGRGKEVEGESAADYFEAVVRDYQTMAEHAGVVAPGDSIFRDRRVLELGPGNTRSVALLLRTRGALAVEGYDPFDIQSRSREYLASCYEPILRRAGHEATYEHAERLLEPCPVRTSKGALLADSKRFDLVVSRAVLEHVSDLDALFGDLRAVTRDDAVLIHKVDLRCHGQKYDHELDFLLFPEGLYRLMSSHIDIPNRVRLDRYLALGRAHGLSLVYAGSTHLIGHEAVESVRARLARPFRDMAAEVLSVLGVWLVQVGPRHPLAERAAAIRPEDVQRAPLAMLSVY
jgi:SAM-dependent methyltransferase